MSSNISETSSPSRRLRPGARNTSAKTPGTALDDKGCLVVAEIVESFNTPISEEHAWALCHQAAKCGAAILGNEAQREFCLLVTTSHHLLLHKEGQVHSATFLDPMEHIRGPPRTKCSDESKIIANLGLVIFSALDHGFRDDEERNISPDLESLLDSMVSADECAERSETDDEGIERDSGDSDDDGRAGSRSFNFTSILEICSRRLSHHGSSQTADAHYKAVCRAYVAEALELSSFLQKVSTGTHQLRPEGRRSSGYHFGPGSGNDGDPELDQLNFNDWARLWVQVIRDLRQGVKLKKVDFCREPPIEYELTPYEILMDDIRSRRYKLNKVMVDGSLPRRIKKDAHAIILEFIRSRPPLKRAAERVLAPAPTRDQTPIERLMESIRQEHSLSPAAPKDTDRRPSRRRSTSAVKENSTTSGHSNKSSSSRPETKSTAVSTASPKESKSFTHEPQQPQRRLIKADLDLLYRFDSKDTDDDCGYSDDDTPADGVSDFFGHICPEGSQSTPVTPCKKPLHSKEIDKGRRHSICNPTVRDEHISTLITFPFEYTNSGVSAFSNLHGQRTSPILKRRTAKLPRSMSKSMLQEEFFQSNHWQTAIECLSLNLEEVVHIRNVLTKAELEGLPLECSLKEDVEKGKVCFLCLKTRFSLLFGPWGNTCKLCKRTVCNKCYSKMRIPTEQFENVPVSTLSPNISPREEEKEFPGSTKSLTPTSGRSPSPRKNSGENSQVSPSLSRKSLGTDSDSGGQRSISPAHLDEEERDQFVQEHRTFGGNGPRSLPSVHSISVGLMAFKRNFGRNKDGGDKTEQLRGALMVVCHDCRAMVLQIIHSARAKKASLLKHNNPTTLELGVPQISSGWNAVQNVQIRTN